MRLGAKEKSVGFVGASCAVRACVCASERERIESNSSHKKEELDTMTNTRRRAPLPARRRGLTPRTQGKKKDSMVKSARRRQSQRRCAFQGRRKPVCQKQAPIRKIKSRRVLARGCYTQFCEKGDGQECVIAYCGKESSYGDEYQNDGSDEDRNDGDNNTAWKYHRDKDWVPKSYKKNQMHDDSDDLDSAISRKLAQGVTHRGSHNHTYDDDSGDNRDHDQVIPKKHAHNVPHSPQKIAENCHHHLHNDDDNDPDTTHGQSYLNSVDENIFHMNENYPQTENVAYVRRRKRSVNSLHRDCNKGGLPRDGSKCSRSMSHLARLFPLWRKEDVFPSWKNKKPRIICKKQDKAGKAYDVHTSPTYQLPRPHVAVMSPRQEEPPPPTCPNSSAVSSNEVLKDLPKEFPESELTSSLHSDAASTNQPLNTTNGAKSSSPQHAQEETTQDKTGNEKSQGPLAKPKRKKYQPKVLRDMFKKAKSTPRSTKKKEPAQEEDGLQTDKPKQVRKKRQAKRGQNACDSTTESSTKSKKQRGRKQGRAALTSASAAFKDSNRSTESSCTFNGESSLIPLQPSVLFQESNDQESRNSTSQNLTQRDVACLLDLLANKAELSMYKHMASSTPELITCMQGNEPCLYGQFFAQQQVPRFIYESQLASPLKSMEKYAIASDKLSRIHSKPDSFTQQLLTQEPHNQLEMVVYNQKREMVISKSAKSRVKIRAKVQLDAESERMWPLLVSGGIPNEYDDASHWERETPIMEKHVRLFIHNMQAVQGDRHFSPWKGSILDSVVGAFLTQNVSDHLSSSAFMSVAARYPSKQRSNTENTNLPDEILNRENETALEMSSHSYGIKSGNRDTHNTSSSSVVAESSMQQENTNVPSFESSAKINSSCGTIESTQRINHHLSLRGVKSFLRNNEASQPIEIKDTDNKSDLLTPIGTSTAVTDEDSVKQCGMQPVGNNFTEQILLEQSRNSSSNLNHTYSQPVNYMRQRGMHHLDRASSHLMEGNVLVESKDSIPSVDNDSNITVDSTGEMGSEHASFHLPTKQDDTKNKPRLSHNGRSTDYTGQVGMQNLEKASSQLDTLLKPCSNSISDLGHHDGTSGNHTRQSGMQHLENPSQSLMGANEPSDISTSSLGLHHYTGQVDLQHLDKAFPCSVEEDISMNQNDLHGNSIFEKQDPCDHDNSGGEHFGNEKSCYLLCTKVRFDDESVSTASKARELVDGSNTNTLLQEVGHSIAESSTFEQCKSDGSWSSPDPRTEVYSKTTVCRSLFQIHVSAQINSTTTALINSIHDEQASVNFDTSHIENHLAVIQESKQMACGSGNVHKSVETFPVSTIVGNKRRHALSGIERAHLEESQHGRKKNQTQDWESMRRQTLESCSSHEKTCEENLRRDDFQDSVDWDAVRRAPVEELAETIKERGMHHVLSGRIKAFLKTLHEEQGNMDLEWLRKVSPENAKAYLTNIRGLGVKSVECIRLLTLHHVAFPVDVNVGRICVRLGWVPIEPLPEQLQLHLLELYPVQETIQKFLWPRLCMLDQKTLYELHYQLITFGKVFCTKSKPNCNACPMRTNCKHFASAYASAKLLLTGPDNEPSKKLCSGTPIPALTNLLIDMAGKTMAENVEGELASQGLEKDYNTGVYLSKCQQYYVEEPASPEETHEPEIEEDIEDIEDFPYIYGSLNDFTQDLLEVSELPYESINAYSNYTHKQVNKKWEQGIKSVGAEIEASCFTTTDVNEGATNALVSLPEGAYIPAPKLKNIDRLRTVHYVYELPDDHPLLEQADIRDTDDPSFYLLAIWSPGEAPDSLSGINEDRHEDLCGFSGSTNANETVSGTLLIPCRTAMRGSFPLNGTYFQVNEVFADHDSSLCPFQVLRSHIWRLQRRFVYFGTSVSSIFRGLTLDEITSCFLRGYVCVRGFDRKHKTPRPLVCRLHFPISKQIQRHKKDDADTSYRK